MQKLLIGMLALTTVALGVLCSVQWRQLRALQANAPTTAAAETRATEIAAREAQAERIKDLERANQHLEQQVQKFATVTTQLRTNEAQQASNLALLRQRMQAAQKARGGTSAPAEDGTLGKGMGEMLGTMMKDPAMREMMREQQKVGINMMYAGLFKDLNLSPEEKEKLKDILTDAQMKNMESAPGLFGGNKETAAADAGKVFEEAKKHTDAELKALLGDERYAYFEDYQKNLGERMQVDQLKTQLAGQNLALQDQQTAQLLQIMKDEKAIIPPIIPTDNTQFPRQDLFTAENLDKQVQWMEDYNRRVLERARQVLTPEQLTHYQTFQQQQASMQKLGLKMAGQMFGGDRSAPPAQ
jgi:hypothetical protein